MRGDMGVSHDVAGRRSVIEFTSLHFTLLVSFLRLLSTLASSHETEFVAKRSK